MKRSLLSIAVVAMASYAAALTYGQNRQAATAVIPSVTFEILDQPDSPLNISIDEKVAARMPGAPLRLTNHSSSTINALVLHIKGGLQDHSYMVFVASKGIAPGANHLQGVSIPRVAENADRPTISLDYVQFVDGKTWGADSLGKSVQVRAFFEGRNLAFSRLKELIAGPDEADIMKSFDMFRSSSFGEPVFPAGRGPRSQDFFAKGYEEIVNILRRMPKRTEEAQELARKLELMQRPGTQ